MSVSSSEIAVYLEIGQKRTIAGALDWLGWCRSGRDEASALQALFEYVSRHARIFQGTGMLPSDWSTPGRRFWMDWPLPPAARSNRAGRVAGCVGHPATLSTVLPGMCSIMPGRSKTACSDLACVAWQPGRLIPQQSANCAHALSTGEHIP